MLTPFEFTDDEYIALLDAVRYAKENAVSSESGARFSTLQTELIRQSEEHEPYPIHDSPFASNHEDA